MTRPSLQSQSSRAPSSSPLSPHHPRGHRMPFLRLLQQISARLPALSAAYPRLAPDVPELAPYPTLASLHATLTPNALLDLPRKKLLCALLEHHRGHPHELWSTLSIGVFARVLRKVRRRLDGDEGDVRDALVLDSFLEAIVHARTDDAELIVCHVRQATFRRALRELRRRQRWERVGFGVEADLEPDPVTLEEPALHTVWMGEMGLDKESAELLVTVGDRGALLRLVRQRHPDDPEQQKLAFRCLQKQRARLVTSLRRGLREENWRPGMTRLVIPSAPPRLSATSPLPSGPTPKTLRRPVETLAPISP